MNTNPNGYSGGDVAGFLDPSPWLEGCDRMNCTAIVGGDHAPTCEVSQWSCYICHDTLGQNDATWTNVNFGLHVERVCDSCTDKAGTDEYLTEVLDNAD